VDKRTYGEAAEKKVAEKAHKKGRAKVNPATGVQAA